MGQTASFLDLTMLIENLLKQTQNVQSCKVEESKNRLLSFDLSLIVNNSALYRTMKLKNQNVSGVRGWKRRIARSSEICMYTDMPQIPWRKEGRRSY